MSGHPKSDVDWMAAALDNARQAERMGEVPVGAVLVRDGERLADGWNRVIADHDPTAHAEIVALRDASRKQGNYRLPDTTLYVTLEPCSMCAGAIINARVRRVVYAAADPKAGAAGSIFEVLQNSELNHRCVVTSGVLAEQSAEMLRQFFRGRR